VNIIPQIKKYKINGPNQITIPEEGIIYLPMEERRDTSVLRGMVINTNGNPVDSVYIDVESGLANSITDDKGLFTIKVPAAEGETILLTALKNGLTGYRELVTVSSGSVTIRFKDSQ
jgi:hypothetical protein